MGVFICICWRVEDATKKRKESAGGEKLNSTIEITGREMKGKKKGFKLRVSVMYIYVIIILYYYYGGTEIALHIHNTHKSEGRRIKNEKRK